jgi:hypothetical protein
MKYYAATIPRALKRDRFGSMLGSLRASLGSRPNSCHGSVMIGSQAAPDDNANRIAAIRR